MLAIDRDEDLFERQLPGDQILLGEVRHESLVHFSFTLSEPAADAFIARLDDAAQGRVAWLRA